MSGLELAKAYYEEYGVPMIKKEFPEYVDRIAVGLVGHGSECFGFDDEISRDHDFEPGFCIWLTEEDEREFGFRLFRAYRKLPKEYMGFHVENKSLFGSDTRGVKTIKDFYSFYLPDGTLPKTNEEWMAIPDFYLAEATNGEVFTDPVGEFSRIRNEVKYRRPEDVRLKKLASAIFYMAQMGQYNYKRCLDHGEYAAASLALSDFVRSAAEAFFLLQKEYVPYYKWMFRRLSQLPGGEAYAARLTKLMSAPFDRSRNLPIIEELAELIADGLRNQQLTTMAGDYLEPYAYDITEHITDGRLRNSPVML